jgi:predicted ester cyclase
MAMRQVLRAFPDRKGGNHYCQIGDGDYAAVSGWPSMTMTHQGEYLGMPATGRTLTLRVMDFYRCAGGRIMENWVLLESRTQRCGARPGWWSWMGS